MCHRLHRMMIAMSIDFGVAPPLANTLASGSQQAAQLSPRAAPPAECHDRKKLNRPTKGAHIIFCGVSIVKLASVHIITNSMLIDFVLYT